MVWALQMMVQRMTLSIVQKRDSFARAWRQKLNFQLSVLVYQSDAVNLFIPPSDEEDDNEEMNVIEDETDEEFII